MKSSLVLILISFFTIACSTANIKKEKVSQFSISKNLIVNRITSNTFVVKDISFYNSNVLVAKMSDDTVIIVSSPIETVRTQSMLKWIQDELRPKKILAINTHFHADGTGGNEAYHSVNAEIWSSEDTHNIYLKRAKSMQLGLADFVKDKSLSELVLKRKNLPPTKLFDTTKAVEWVFDKEKVIINYPGPAHSSDNIIVYFPARKVLFGGCILRALDWKSLGNLKDANLDKYYDSARSLLRFDSNLVIPGHGSIGDKSLIYHTMELAKKILKK